MAVVVKVVVLAMWFMMGQQLVLGYDFNFTTGGPFEGGIYQAADFYNSHGIEPDQYAQDLLGALNSSGVPLNMQAATAAHEPPMYTGSTLPEVEEGFVAAMDEALEAGRYRTYGYICTGAISYNPVANGGEGAAGQSQCITAIQSARDQANATTIFQGACAATTSRDLMRAGAATSKGAQGGNVDC